MAAERVAPQACRGQGSALRAVRLRAVRPREGCAWPRNALVDGVPMEIGDGGFTDWTAKLLASKKERLLISGYGLDQLAVLIDDALIDDEPTRD